MKSSQNRLTCQVIASHPARGAWIEIDSIHAFIAKQCGRTPHGVRGLKSGITTIVCLNFRSHPARGAWIEMSLRVYNPTKKWGRTPHGVRGLKSEGLITHTQL